MGDAGDTIIDGFAGLVSGSLTWFCDPKSWGEPIEGQSEGCGGDWSIDEQGQLGQTGRRNARWRQDYLYLRR